MRRRGGGGERCECRDVDKGGERVVKGRQSGERWGVEEAEEEWKKDIWGEKERSKIREARER